MLGLRDIPQTITDVNVFVNAKGYLGVAKKMTLPKIEFNTLELKGAVDADYSTGSLKKLETTFTVSVIDMNQFTAVGINQFTNYVPFVFKASLSQGKTTIPLIASLSGDILSHEIKEFEGSKEIEAEIKIAVHFYELIVMGSPMVLIDRKNMICMLGGIDYHAKVRTNLL